MQHRQAFREALSKFGDSKYCAELIDNQGYDPVDMRLKAHADQWAYIKKTRQDHGDDPEGRDIG